MIENATVEDLQHELQVMISETLDDMGDDAPDEGSVAVELFNSMTYSDYSASLLAEVARREFGYVPMGARADVSDAFGEVEW
jgi:hypothetical protein